MKKINIYNFIVNGTEINNFNPRVQSRLPNFAWVNSDYPNIVVDCNEPVYFIKSNEQFIITGYKLTTWDESDKSKDPVETIPADIFDLSEINEAINEYFNQNL